MPKIFKRKTARQIQGQKVREVISIEELTTYPLEKGLSVDPSYLIDEGSTAKECLLCSLREENEEHNSVLIGIIDEYLTKLVQYFRIKQLSDHVFDFEVENGFEKLNVQ